MINNVKSQDTHDKLLILQIVNYNKQGYTDIKVNHSNYSHGLPEKVGGYLPDLSAVLNHKVVICRVVTDDTMNDLSNIHLWKVFSNSSYEFHMIVPRNSLNDIKELAKINGISVDKYWYSNV